MLQSQTQCKANFQAIFNTFSENHTQINNDLQGTHNTLTFQENKGADPATGSDQVALYTNLVGSPGVPVLFYRPHNSATPIQLTYKSISTTPTLNNQYSFVAGPFVVYIGHIPAAIDGQVITLSPSTTLLYVQTSSLNRPDTKRFGVPVTGIISGLSQFTIKFVPLSNSVGPDIDLYYFAIGKE
jgi:hypothetical protein